MDVRHLRLDTRTASLLELVAVLLVWICSMPLAGQSNGRTEVATGSASGLELSRLAPSISIQAFGGTPETADALIEQMSAAAGVIFAGEVTAVRRPVGFAGSGQDAAEGIVEVDLRVDQPLRGPDAGSTYTLREWAGLWAGGVERYKAGQRLLLFLYAPDAHGLGGLVHGAEGAIPLRGSGAAPGPDDASTKAAEWLVDLRWLQARALRKPVYGVGPVLIRGGPGGAGGPRHPVSEEPFALPYEPDSRAVSISIERSGLSSRSLLAPELVYAVLDAWAISDSGSAEAQPLSEVLALCQKAMNAHAPFHDPVRQRNGSR